MFAHKVGKYEYASTRRYVIDPESGTEQRRVVHWGTVDESRRFHPNTAFLYLAPAERDKMIYPQGWDVGEIAKLPSERSAGRPVCEVDSSRFYGDIWLLEQIAEKTGVRHDLLAAFDGCTEIVEDILSLAMFGYLSKLPYSHMKAWQDLGRFPAVHSLDPGVITQLCQAITEGNRLAFFKARASRAKRDELCAVDSTTRRAYGRCLAEITYGKNKDDGLKVPQTIEVVVYTLTRHEPIWYTSFAGNMSDKRTLPVILRSLEHAGFGRIVIITDRGYDCPGSLDYCILHHQPLITAATVRKKFILDIIEGMGTFGSAPPGMDWISDKAVFASQYEIEKRLTGRGGHIVTSDKLRLNLYFDPIRRAEELVVLQDDIEVQRAALENLKTAGEALSDRQLKNFRYFHVKRDPNTHCVESFERNHRKIRLAERVFGFFAILTHQIDYTAARTLEVYGLRDEQEKFFMRLKTQQAADRQRCSSDLSRDGRRFIEFVGMILLSQLSYAWRSSEELRNAFPYVFAMIEEMRRIRCIEHQGRQRIITPFVGRQVTLCQVLGLDIPKGCEPVYESPVIHTGKKRGRPRKT